MFIHRRKWRHRTYIPIFETLSLSFHIEPIIKRNRSINQRKNNQSWNLSNSLHPLITTTTNGRRRRITDRLPYLLSFSLERPSLLGNPMDVTVTILPLLFLLSHRYPYRYVHDVSLALLYIFVALCRTDYFVTSSFSLFFLIISYGGCCWWIITAWRRVRSHKVSRLRKWWYAVLLSLPWL